MKTTRFATEGGLGPLFCWFREAIKFLLLILLAEAVLFLIGIFFFKLAYAGPHDFSQKDCLKCHEEPYERPGDLAVSVSRICRDCHARLMRASSHPVDIKPERVEVPSDLPLRNGKLTCVTCHDFHGPDKIAYGMKSYLLRRPATELRFFCSSCHAENRYKPGHVEMTDLAHMGGRYRAARGGEDLLDPLSLQCLGCHDGAGGGSVYSPDEEALSEFYFDMKSSGAHPIGLRYADAQAGKGLAPVARLDGRVKFFGGKVGCGTCHDYYSALPARLVMRNDESRLCRQCHYDK